MNWLRTPLAQRVVARLEQGLSLLVCVALLVIACVALTSPARAQEMPKLQALITGKEVPTELPVPSNTATSLKALRAKVDEPLGDAIVGAASDCLTTSVFIWLEMAVEANPIFAWAGPYAPVVGCALKYPLIRYANNLPEPRRTHNLSLQSSLWHAAGAWNLVSILAGSTGGGLVAALAVGFYSWHSTAPERERAEFCVWARDLHQTHPYPEVGLSIQRSPAVTDQCTADYRAKPIKKA